MIFLQGIHSYLHIAEDADETGSAPLQEEDEPRKCTLIPEPCMLTPVRSLIQITTAPSRKLDR